MSVSATRQAPDKGLTAGDEQEWPTLWGLNPLQLHDRFWASRGARIVRAGDGSEPDADAELYVLTDPQTLSLFALAPMLDRVYWNVSRFVIVRLTETQPLGYREHVVVDRDHNFVRFERRYKGSRRRLTRVAVTTDVRIARQWAHISARKSWRHLRRTFFHEGVAIISASGRMYDTTDADSVSRFVTDLIRLWPRPDATISNLVKVHDGVWAPLGTVVSRTTHFVGPTWIGAGRSVPAGESVLGPAALWDDPASRFQPEQPEWSEIEPTGRSETALGGRKTREKERHIYLTVKRIFDFCFALLVLGLSGPLFPMIMFLIWLEDGRPFFFAHRRETLGGAEFGCLKFRSMRKDAEKIKAELQKVNQADGPQFFMDNDPRLTRVGRFLRKTNLDEIPQFWNVLKGEMSVVGPRPSPYAENQYSPSWRESRLSVKPGITGLWQVSRTRQAGTDFQEWIKFDLQYVRTAGIRTDLRIVLATVRMMLGLTSKS